MAFRLASAARYVAVLLLLAALLFSLAMAWNSAGWAASVAEAAIFSLTGITALRAMFTGEASYPPAALTLFGACIWIAGQLLFHRTVYMFATFQSCLVFLSIACAFWSALQLFQGPDAVRRARKVLVVIGSSTAAFSIIYLLTSNGRIYWTIATLDSWRPMGPFLNANHNAVFMELILPLAVWEAVKGERTGFLYSAASALMYSSVIVSGSRAGVVLATLEIVILLCCSLFRTLFQRRTLLPGLLLVLMLIAATAFSDWRPVVSRFRTNNMFQQRRELLQSTVMMIREHPMSGSGLGTWGIVYPRFAVFEPRLAVYHAHNEWAEWMAEGGLPFVGLLWGAVIRAITLIRKFPWGLGVSTAALHAFVDFPFHVYTVLLCFVLVMAFMESALRQDTAPSTLPLFRRRADMRASRQIFRSLRHLVSHRCTAPVLMYSN